MCSPVVWLIMTYYPMIRKTHFSKKNYSDLCESREHFPRKLNIIVAQMGFRKIKVLRKNKRTGFGREADEMNRTNTEFAGEQTRGEDTNIQLNQRNLLFTASFMFQENVMLHFCR